MSYFENTLFNYAQVSIDAGDRLHVSQFTSLHDGKVVNGHTPLFETIEF